MIGCLRTRVRKQPIIALYFESELVLKFYNLEVRLYSRTNSSVRKTGPRGRMNAGEFTVQTSALKANKLTRTNLL